MIKFLKRLQWIRCYVRGLFVSMFNLTVTEALLDLLKLSRLRKTNRLAAMEASLYLRYRAHQTSRTQEAQSLKPETLYCNKSSSIWTQVCTATLLRVTSLIIPDSMISLPPSFFRIHRLSVSRSWHTVNIPHGGVVSLFRIIKSSSSPPDRSLSGGTWFLCGSHWDQTWETVPFRLSTGTIKSSARTHRLQQHGQPGTTVSGWGGERAAGAGQQRHHPVVRGNCSVEKMGLSQLPFKYIWQENIRLSES